MSEDKKKQGDSSRYALRLPPDLHEEIQALAKKNFHSVNAEIVRLIRLGMDADKQVAKKTKTP